MIILSFRDSYECRCSRSCNCLLDSKSCDFDTRAVETIDEAADYIAGRLNESPKSEFANYVFTNWNGLVNTLDRGTTLSPSRGIQSITGQYTYIGEDYFEEEEELISEIRQLVSKRLKS
jgi:hypothetical protein